MKRKLLSLILLFCLFPSCNQPHYRPVTEKTITRYSLIDKTITKKDVKNFRYGRYIGPYRKSSGLFYKLAKQNIGDNMAFALVYTRFPNPSLDSIVITGHIGDTQVKIIDFANDRYVIDRDPTIDSVSVRKGEENFFFTGEQEPELNKEITSFLKLNARKIKRFLYD